MKLENCLKTALTAETLCWPPNGGEPELNDSSFELREPLNRPRLHSLLKFGWSGIPDSPLND